LKTFATLFFASVSLVAAQTIATRTLTPGETMSVALNPKLTTTLLFPEPISGTFGLGLVSGTNTNGTIQIEHPDGSRLLILHPITDNAHVIATVFMNDILYTLDLASSNIPDVAVTFIIRDISAATKTVEVTPQEIHDARPVYSADQLIGLLRRARDSVLLRPLYPDLYKKYASRETQYISDSGSVKTTVTTVHRFSKEDAIVLQGVCENLTDKPLTFDGRAATVQVNNLVEPVKICDCLRPIPPHTKTLIDVVIQGGVDGGREDLALDNEFRIMLPGDTGIWNLKNGVVPDKGFKVDPPIKHAPMAQARVKRDPQ
jgi:hypothetical protein